MKKTALLYAVIFALSAGLLWALSRPGPTPVAYREVIVDTIIGEPDTVRTFVDRIVYRERDPEIVYIDREGGEDVVEDFCRPDTVLVADSIWVPADTVFLLRSVSHDPGWFLRRDRVTVWGPTSTGDMREVHYRTYPGWSLRVGSESVFREPRFGWWRNALEAGIYFGLGYIGGKIF